MIRIIASEPLPDCGQLQRSTDEGPTHVPKAGAEEKLPSTHGQGKIRGYVHKLLFFLFFLLLQHNALIAF